MKGAIIMYCQKCGTEGTEGGFCSKCGEKLGGTINQNNGNFQQIQQPAFQQQYQQPPINTEPRCPKCGGVGKKSYKAWQVLVGVIFFPIGLVTLFIPKEYKCKNCKTWY